jgi:tRNA-dependent cyclodipeptide synthase
MTTDPKYTLRRAIPSLQKASVLGRQKISLGVSLDNEEFYGKNLNGILTWIENRYEECLIFVGDCLYAYTLQIFSPMDAVAVEQAVAKSAKTFRDQVIAFTSNSKTRFKMVSLAELSHRPEFQTAKTLIEKLYEGNEQFHSSVKKTATDYIQRKSKNGRLTMNSEKAVLLSVQYLLDEIAFYYMLVSDGWLLEVYPGSEIPVLREIIQGKIQNVPEILKQRVFLELRKEKL